jgi:hypothetical protein
MILSNKIMKAVEQHPEIVKLLYPENKMDGWANLTRTHFNNVAQVINKKVTQAVISNADLVAHNFVIGKLKMEKDILNFRCVSVAGFIQHLSKRSEYQVYNWVSGKTLHSYWNNGSAKDVKVNALLVFLQVPLNDWDFWIKDRAEPDSIDKAMTAFPFKTVELNHASLAIVKKYYTGNYYLYYQKTDGSSNIIKTPFVIKEQTNGELMVQSISEGHRYIGKVMSMRDGCLYINCQNLDFEEMEQYVFNIGLETNPEVLFGVSTTVSVKERLGVALKNVLVKQKMFDAAFESQQEIEIPFSKIYNSNNEEAIIVGYLKKSVANIIKTKSCCNLRDLV